MGYFKQESAVTGTFLPNGHRITLDFIDESTGDGYIASDNGYVVNQIRTAVAQRSGGWLEVSEVEYNEALKKKASPQQLSPAQKRKSLNAGMFQSLRASPVDPAAAVVPAAKPDPISVPTPEQMKLPPRPRVGKMTT